MVKRALKVPNLKVELFHSYHYRLVKDKMQIDMMLMIFIKIETAVTTS